MKIGLCTSEKELILLARKVGFDFVEVNASGAVMKDEKYAMLLELSRELPDGFMYSCNGLVPGDVRLTGPEADEGKIREYAETSFARLASLGVKMIVFGSSAAKRVPEGFSFDKATEQLVAAMRIFSDEAAKHGQRVCIEPLRYAECNIINTLEDSLELARLTARENVGAHVDYFHLMQNGERLAKLEGAAKKIMHTLEVKSKELENDLKKLEQDRVKLQNKGIEQNQQQEQQEFEMRKQDRILMYLKEIRETISAFAKLK